MTTAEAKIVDSFNASVTKVADAQTKAFIGGVNLRLNVAALFRAVAATVDFAATAGKAAATFDPVALMKLATKGYATVIAGLDAVRDKVGPLGYAVCTVVASEPDGVAKDKLKERVDAFLVKARADGLPWYLGFSRDSLDRAKGELDEPGGVDKTLKTIHDSTGLISDDGKKVRFTSVNYVWGFTKEKGDDTAKE